MDKAVAIKPGRQGLNPGGVIAKTLNRVSTVQALKRVSVNGCRWLRRAMLNLRHRVL